MLLASKLRESRPLAGETLVYYTDHSVTKQQLWVSLYLTFVALDLVEPRLWHLKIKETCNAQSQYIFFHHLRLKYT